jgi:hypothetical protein
MARSLRVAPKPCLGIELHQYAIGLESRLFRFASTRSAFAQPPDQPRKASQPADSIQPLDAGLSVHPVLQRTTEPRLKARRD